DGAYRYNGSFFDENGLPWRYREVSNASTNGQLRQNEVQEWLQIPLDRYSLFGRGHIDLTDNLRVFTQVLYSRSKTEQRQAASPMRGGWRAGAPHGDGTYLPSLAGPGPDGIMDTGDEPTNPDYLPGGRFGLSCPPVGGCSKSEAFPTPPELTLLLDSRLDPE